MVFPSLTDGEKALVRSQSGSGAGTALSTVRTHQLVCIDSQLFRVHCPAFDSPFPSHGASAGVAAPSHHRAPCARAGVLARRGFALESAAARVCREAGARVTTNVMVRDLDLGVMNVHDARRVEVIADGFPPWRSTTGGGHHNRPGSALRRDAPARGVGWVRLLAARRRKERTYPELVAPTGAVVWSSLPMRWADAGPQRHWFLRLFAREKDRSEPPLMRMRAQQAWKIRWLSILACASARVVTVSLLGSPKPKRC